ncbi:hypothetical protein [Myxococcus hansupus]|uniref:hypothetical protein n=1 Tax=Pseudomyxococcus hansupus TaxID=1297742 RepID=UPI000AC9F63A|nr:hypothetical protein [Myxococcus hansupus]
MRTKLAATVFGLASLFATPAALAAGDLSPVQDWNCDGAINSYDLFLYETNIWRRGMPSWPLGGNGQPIFDRNGGCNACHESMAPGPQEDLEDNELLVPFGVVTVPKCV